ncbi:MAG: polymer-forming cytoskeletal protein [Candidatus Zixiibacteriota bacterium]|nr:MAG: polymer-forming cytoskeletal protein [candidate division Zixibacteria bacterium]
MGNIRFFLVCGVFCALAASVAGQAPDSTLKPPPHQIDETVADAAAADRESDSGETDTTLIELHLSPNGVYGVDTAGREWDYDFRKKTFTIEKQGTSRTITVFRKKGERLEEVPDAPEPPEIKIVRFDGLQMGSVVIEEDQKVVGSIVAVGPVTVQGRVTGDVISYSLITVTSTGRISGDARAPRIVKMRGGRIMGSRSETDLPRMPEFEFLEKRSSTQLIVSIFILLFFLFCGFLAVVILPKPVDRLKVCVQTSPVKSFFAGFLVWILLTPAMALLCLTIIGIPIAILVLPIALVVGEIIGVAGLGQMVGEKSRRWFSFSYESQLMQVIIGLIILSLVWVLAGLFRTLPSEFGQGLSTFLTVIAIIVWSLAVTMSIGAVALTRFGCRDCRKVMMEKLKQTDVAPFSAPPPPPSPPPLKSDDD